MTTKGRKLSRTFKEGWINFYREGWLSFAAVTILSLALYVLSVTVIISLSTYIALQNVQEHVNVSVYFHLDVPEEKILAIKDQVDAAKKEVKSVEYISRDQALEDFRTSVKDDPLITETLNELDENPLPASLVITAKKSDDYAVISESLQNTEFANLIMDINYEENKEVIDRAGSIIGFIQKIGFGIAIVFIFIAILITFNTVRMTLYTRAKEYEIMRLVGASNLYVKMPSIFEGIFYGLAGSLMAVILLFFTAIAVRSVTAGFFGSDNALQFYYAHFAIILASLILVGGFLGMISSFIAIRRYLEH